MRSTAWRTVLALVLVLIGCDADGTGPGGRTFDGVYALRSVNGAELPADITEGGGERYIMLGDTLRFSTDGLVTRHTVFRHLSSMASVPADSIYEITLTMPYRLVGTRVTIGERTPCPPNASCVGIEEGSLNESAAVLVGSLLWPGEPLLSYRRADR